MYVCGWGAPQTTANGCACCPTSSSARGHRVRFISARPHAGRGGGPVACFGLFLLLSDDDSSSWEAGPTPQHEAHKARGWARSSASKLVVMTGRSASIFCNESGRGLRSRQTVKPPQHVNGGSEKGKGTWSTPGSRSSTRRTMRFVIVSCFQPVVASR